MSAKAWIVDCKTSHLANTGRGEGTNDSGITVSGDVTIHPRAIELPLKNIVDANQWW